MSTFLRKEIIAPVIILIVCILLCKVSKEILYKVFKLKIVDGRKKTILNLIKNIVRSIILLIGILVTLEIYGIDTKSLVASLGIVGLVAGLALQDTLKDFIAGITIIFEGQYSIGDWISIDGFKGEVIPSNLRTTKIKAYTGEVKIISNRNITEIINYSLEDSNLILDVDVSYNSDIEKVNSILEQLCETVKEKHKLKNITCLGIQELSNNSIRFRLVVETKYLDQFSIDRKLKKEILLVFAKNDIVIPYNQVVIHNG